MISLPETKGARVVKFIEKFCVHGEGDFFGNHLNLMIGKKQSYTICMKSKIMAKENTGKR